MTFRDNDGETHEADLLPCPFCGGEPAVRFEGNSHTTARKVVVHCRQCRASRTHGGVRMGFGWLVERAATAWNQRATAHAPEVG